MASYESSNNNASQPEASNAALVINTQYLKDLTFESPNPLKFFQSDKQAPDINVGINIHVQTVSEKIFEVTLKVNAEATRDQEKIFIIEVEYAGIFTSNVSEEELHPILMIECPRHLFPYVRQIVANATREGGFPALNLNPIDFVDMYRQQLEQNQQPPKLDA